MAKRRQFWINVGLGGTKPLPEGILTYHTSVPWHSHENIFPEATNDIKLFDVFENSIIKITAAYPRGQWVHFPCKNTLFWMRLIYSSKKIPMENYFMCPCLWWISTYLNNGLVLRSHPVMMYNNYDGLFHGYIRQEDGVNGIRWGIWLPENDIWSISIIVISVKGVVQVLCDQRYVSYSTLIHLFKPMLVHRKQEQYPTEMI